MGDVLVTHAQCAGKYITYTRICYARRQAVGCRFAYICGQTNI